MRYLTKQEFFLEFNITGYYHDLFWVSDSEAAVEFLTEGGRSIIINLSDEALEILKDRDMHSIEIWDGLLFYMWLDDAFKQCIRIEKKSAYYTSEDLQGSRWRVGVAGSTSEGAIMEFLPGGRLTYGGFSGSWQPENGGVVFSIKTTKNDYYGRINRHHFSGTITDQLLGIRANLIGEFIGNNSGKTACASAINASDIVENSKETTRLVNSIFETIRDYRAGENNPEVKISEDHIRTWIGQFDRQHRIALLTETDNILKKRYCSANSARNFILAMLRKLSEFYSHPSPSDFLRNAVFLDLQPPGKSQGEMLRMLDTVISLSFGISLAQCGSVSKKYSIYLDDVLCTGKTLYDDIEEWSSLPFSERKTNRKAVEDGSTRLILAYIFLHAKNYQKCKTRLKINVSEEFSGKITLFKRALIQNDVDEQSKIDLILPAEGSHPVAVTEYQNEITARADNWNQRYGRISPDEFFRPASWPQEEAFFTSQQNRILIENAFLVKGIEILKGANAVNPNIRALGYSIPSHKNFGFGALCFTWRNVPNNTPLVFWYSAGNFTPLFQVKRGLYLSPEAPASGPHDDDLPF